MLQPLKDKLDRNGTVVFTVKAHAGAPLTKIKEILGDGTVKIDVAAVREEGKANAELIRFLAEEFDVAKQQIEIMSGHSAGLKRIRVVG